MLKKVKSQRKHPHHQAGVDRLPYPDSDLVSSSKKNETYQGGLTDEMVKKAVASLDAANVPRDNRLFVFDERTPTFKRLKRQKRIREVEPGIWEIIK